MTESISTYIQQLCVTALPLLFAIVMHELAHGWVAYRLGDDTAKVAGRLTLNPIKHLDPLGLLVFLLTRIIGWAKPVPINPGNFTYLRRDMILVALAGPGMNFTLCIGSAAVFNMLINAINRGMFSNSTAFFIIPITVMLKFSVIINVALGVFNLIPILPLDGGRILWGLLPPFYAMKYAKIERYGFILIILLIITNVFERMIVPIIYTIAKLLIRM